MITLLAGLRRRFTYANLMASIAVFVALGAGAYAAGLAPDSVGSRQIKDGRVKTQDVKDQELTGVDIEDGSLGRTDLAPEAVPRGQLILGAPVVVPPQAGSTQLAPIVVPNAGLTLATLQVERGPQQVPLGADCTGTVQSSATGNTLQLADFKIPATTGRAIGTTTVSLDGGGVQETLVFEATCFFQQNATPTVTPSVNVVEFD